MALDDQYPILLEAIVLACPIVGMSESSIVFDTAATVQQRKNANSILDFWNANNRTLPTASIAALAAAKDAKESVDNPERNDLRKKIAGFIQDDVTFNQIPTPTNREVLDHVANLNRQMLVVLRSLKKELLE